MIARKISPKFVLFVLAILGLFGSNALAQTNVSGTISLDTTWDLAGSPYIVTANLFVEGTDGPDSVTTLTIDPGVEVRSQSSVGIFVGSSSGSGNPGAVIGVEVASVGALVDGEADGEVVRALVEDVRRVGERGLEPLSARRRGAAFGEHPRAGEDRSTG